MVTLRCRDRSGPTALDCRVPAGPHETRSSSVIRNRLAANGDSILACLVVPTASRTGGASASPPLVKASSSRPAPIPVQAGFGSNETFCAQPPLKGAISYQVKSGRATLGVGLEGLPRRTLVGIDWANNTVRGYLVGDLRTDSRCASLARTATSSATAVA